MRHLSDILKILTWRRDRWNIRNIELRNTYIMLKNREIFRSAQFRGVSFLMGNARSVFLRKAQNFETPFFRSKFWDPLFFRPLTSIYASLLYSEVAAGVFEQYIRPSNVLICIFQKKWKFWKKVGLTLKLIWDPLNFLLKILDPLFCCPKIWDPLKTLRVGIPH